MKKIVLSVAVASFMSTGVYAEDFRAELDGLYISSDSEGVDADGLGLQGRLHFNTVDTSNGPLSEAAFLAKSSSAGLLLLRTEVDDPFFGDEDTDVAALDVRMVAASDWIFEASYQDLDDETVFGFGVGKYISDNTDIVFNVNMYDEADVDQYSVSSHTVNELSGDTAFGYDLGLSYLDGQGGSATSINAGGTYYFNKQFGLGADVELLNGDGFDSSTITVAAEYFFTPKTKVALGYQTLGKDADGDSIIFTLGARF